MTTFTGTSAIAFTWTADGLCRGVSVRRVRDRCRVLRWWEAQKVGDRSLAEALAEGLRALEPDAATVTVVGGDAAASSCLDLDMPALRSEELRNALAFELRRSAPIPDEKLTWAYRVLPGPDRARIRVRLYYLRQTIWEQWISHLSAFSHGLDVVIPPAAALDPVLGGQPVRLGTPTGYVLMPTANGGREAHVPGEDSGPTTAFGDGPTPLATAGLDPGGLAELPPEQQAGFAPTVVLAMYGLSRSLQADRSTGLDLPYELRPRRHRAARILASALAVYTAVVALYGLGKLYADQRQQFRTVHEERRQIEGLVDDAGKRLHADEAKFIEQLRAESEALIQPRPSLAAVLAEVTRRVGNSGWCTAFRWSEGAISVQLRESQEIEDLEKTLEQSPLLGDVRQESKKVQAGVIDRKVEMNARYDIGNEQSAPPPLPPSVDEGDDFPDLDDVDDLDQEALAPAGTYHAPGGAPPALTPPADGGAPAAGAPNPASGPATTPPPPPPPPPPSAEE